MRERAEILAPSSLIVRARTLARIALGLAILFVILVLPNHATDLRAAAASAPLPIELPVILVALLATRGVPFRLLRLLVVLLSIALVFLKLADIATFEAFSRPFNPLLDAHIVIAGWHLLSGTVGWTEAVLGVAAALAGLVALGILLDWSLSPIGRLARAPRMFAAGAALTLIFAGALALAGGIRPLPITAQAGPFVAERIALLERSMRDLARYGEELEADPLADIPAARRLSALAGRDVVVIFVESYGRSVIEDPRYAQATGDRLAAVGRELAAAGLGVRSGWLTAPTVGGQSWLAHGALLSGTWVNSQQRYERMLASDHPSLNALFRAAGWRTIAVMPAITMAWPEAAYFGYDRVYAHGDLGYRGAPFNWVTMPDQYTLSAFERLERQGDGRKTPVMAEIALISSHAPWTPVPDLVDWDAVGDGTIFNEQAKSGDPPAVVWADPERVRRQYALSVDYALETIGAYLARFEEGALFVILGDHQPASIITGEGASRDVPVHIVSSDAALLDRISGWGFAEGMRPAPDGPVWRMDAFRERFVRAFSRLAD